jgi:hypothetical protein
MNVGRSYMQGLCSLSNRGRRATLLANMDAATVWFAIAIVSVVLLAVLCDMTL